MISWLKSRPSVLFLTADDERLAAEDPRRFARVWVGLLGISGLWGLVTIGLWKLADSLFGQTGGIFVMPAAVVSVAIVLGFYRHSAESLVNLLASPRPASRSLVAAVLVVVLAMCLTVLRADWYRPEAVLPEWAAWVRPESKIYRVLLLAPLWGAWTMLILPQFRRPEASDAPIAAALARGCGPLTATILMGLLLGWSIWYFAYLPWTQLTISGAGILAAIGGGLLLVRRRGKMDRDVLLGANLLTQLVVLTAFLANRHLRFW